MAASRRRAERDLEQREKKIREYEKFVEERLKVDLQHVVNERNQIFEQKKQYTDLGKSLRMLEERGTKQMRSLVNLGSEVFMQAEVPDTSRVFVDVGLGFHVEFTRAEALQFIATKEEDLQKKADTRTQQAANIKAQIKLVLEGIRELAELDTKERRRY
eukprot:TRINITY_DN19704_c0_g1_i1.p2 TRINITY_DN19704_c0_g1~~TRINITY_DN19704_c0_g1_i1.p2  ORF type:complete len:159 (-),score=37.90 TRINITY_DN19704_c0_g1_i1:551-1027(-)